MRRRAYRLADRGASAFAWMCLCAEREIDYGRAFLFIPVCLGAGAALWFSLPVDPEETPVVTLFGVSALLSFGMRHWISGWRYVVWSVALVSAGMLLAQIETARKATIILDSPVTVEITGLVERREASGEGDWRYLVRLDETKEPHLRRPPRHISVLARSQQQPIAIGEGIRGRARLSPPSGPALAGLADFAFSAYFDGTGAIGYFYGAPTRLSPYDAGDAGSLQAAIERRLFALRAGIGDRIRSTIAGDAGAFAAALVTDERRAISQETTDALRLSGLSHIIAISGLNMALAAGIFFVGLRSLLALSAHVAQAYPIKKIAAAGALITAIAYYLISGFAVSAERAFLMMAIMLVAVFFDRPSISLRNVALSAILILILSPSEVMQPSFQMSFAATLALVSGYALWSHRRETGLRTPVPPVFALSRATAGFFTGIFLTSLIGGASTAIYAIEHFHRLPTWGLVGNLAAMPVISFIVMPAGLVAMLLMPFGLDGLPLWIMGQGLDVVIAIGKTVAGWGGAVDFPRWHWLWFPLANAGFVLLAVLKTPLRLSGLVLIAMSGLAIATGRGHPIPAILISEDGKLAAITTPDGLSSNRDRPPRFIFQQWQHTLMRPGHHGPDTIRSDLPSAAAIRAAAPPGSKPHFRLSARQFPRAVREMKNAAWTVEPDRFSCVSKVWCIARLSDGTVLAMIDEPAYVGAACDVADIVVSARRPGFQRCRSRALLVTPDMLRKTGALEISTGGIPAEASGDQSLTVTPVIPETGRAWNRHRRYDWRSDSFENPEKAP